MPVKPTRSILTILTGYIVSFRNIKYIDHITYILQCDILIFLNMDMIVPIFQIGYWR